MPGGSRKKPFSGKQKKQQLQTKKTKQQQHQHLGLLEDNENEETSRNPQDYEGCSIVKSGKSGGAVGGSASLVGGEYKFFEHRPAPTRVDAGKYTLMFRPETKEEVQRQKKEARKAIVPVLEEYLECRTEDFYTPELDFPVRPPWSYEQSREDVEKNENRYFQNYLTRIDSTFDRSELSYFELNLETWRQLWRVMEMSDILLCVVDIRFPPLLFPPKLYNYLSTEMGKQVILVLNKIDLCSPSLVLAWKDYFVEKYPGIAVLCFTSFPTYNLHGNVSSKGVNKSRKVRGRLRMSAEGALELFKVCEKIVEDKVDLSKWKKKILEEMNATEEEDEEPVKIESLDSTKPDTGYYEFKKFNGGILTIGCVGQPNVGKSSLINALMGKKVVSVSRTPGHTKHFQTIFLTPNVRLCDCPGLIFPSKVPKALQVLCGSYPIAQLRDPFSTIKYLGQRLDLPKILVISHPEGDIEWSAFDIADGWAQKRGYVTAKAARLDSYRGANHILRLALEGRICLCLRPPGFTQNKETYERDPRIEEINLIQAKSPEVVVAYNNNAIDDVSDDEHSSSDQENAEKTEKDYTMKLKPIQDGVDDEAESEESPDEKIEKQATKNSHQKVIKVRNKFALLNDTDDDDEDD